MIISIYGTDIYINEQQHLNSNSRDTTLVKSENCPEIYINGEAIKQIFIQGRDSFCNHHPLQCKTLQNLNIVVRHLAVWSILNNEPLRIRLNHRT